MQIHGRRTSSTPSGLERLATVVAAGAPPRRAVAAASAFAADLRSRDACWEERLESIESELEESIGAAEAYAAEVEEASRA